MVHALQKARDREENGFAWFKFALSTVEFSFMHCFVVRNKTVTLHATQRRRGDAAETFF